MGKRMRGVVLHIGLALVAGSGVLTGVGCGGESIAPPTTGSLQITTATSGPTPDEDGYTITIDGTDRGTLGTSADVIIDALAPGDHLVGLSGIAANCQAQGENPRTVAVVAGATGTAAFLVACVPPPPATGILNITTTTGGRDSDPNGYAFAVDGGTSQSIGLNVTATIGNVAAGAHMVQLSGVAPNCTVAGTNPRSVAVTAGGTADVTFTITCAAVAAGLGLTTQPSTVAQSGVPFVQQPVVQVLDGTGQPLARRDVTVTATIASGGGTLGGSTTQRTDASGRARFTNLAVTGATGARTLRFEAEGLTGVTSAPITVQAAVSVGRIAWMEVTSFGRNCGCQIWVINGDGTGKRQLVQAPGNHYEFAWAPDGGRMAFVSDEGGGPEDNRDIWIINADGSAKMVLTDTPPIDYRAPYETAPDWSPEGTKIAYVRDGDIWMMNSDGSGQRKLTTTPGIIYDAPVWSPDARRIAFEGDGDIYVVNQDGSGQTRLTNNSAGGGSVSWSPSGDKILFVSNRDGSSEVYIMNPDGTGQTNLTHNLGYDLEPSWSPDGSKIVFTSERGGYARVMVMNADGSMPTLLARGGGGAWSPDGGRIAYVVRSNYEEAVIWVMNADGTNHTQLVELVGELGDFVWVP